MSTHTPTGIDWAETTEPREARREARVAASFAEYLAEYVRGDPDRAVEAVESLAEWCDHDPQRLAQARADVVRDTRRAERAQRVIAAKNEDAVQLLDLAARAS